MLVTLTIVSHPNYTLIFKLFIFFLYKTKAFSKVSLPGVSDASQVTGILLPADDHHGDRNDRYGKIISAPVDTPVYVEICKCRENGIFKTDKYHQSQGCF